MEIFGTKFVKNSVVISREMLCLKFECNLFLKNAVEGTGLQFIYHILSLFF